MNILEAMIGLVLAAIIMIAFLPVLSDLVGDANTAIDNATNLSYREMTKVLISGLGFFFVIGVIIWLYKKLTTPTIDYGAPPLY